MRLKDLINKNVILEVNIGNIFNEEDVENCGEDYDVSYEQFKERINKVISDSEVITLQDYYSFHLK